MLGLLGMRIIPCGINQCLGCRLVKTWSLEIIVDAIKSGLLCHFYVLYFSIYVVPNPDSDACQHLRFWALWLCSRLGA
jgi:hypothetical protein